VIVLDAISVEYIQRAIAIFKGHFEPDFAMRRAQKLPHLIVGGCALERIEQKTPGLAFLCACQHLVRSPDLV
jgi:hypothetical protein